MYSFIKSLQSYFRGVGGCKCFNLDTTNGQDVYWGSGGVSVSGVDFEWVIICGLVRGCGGVF